MAEPSSLGANEIEFDDEMQPLAASGLISFLIAATVLFASLVVGSTASLISIGSHALTEAILRGFLSVGLWASGGFLCALMLSFAAAAILRRRGET